MKTKVATSGQKRKGYRKQEDHLDRAIEAALDPGRFISNRESWDFVEGVQKIADNIQEITAKEPEETADSLPAWMEDDPYGFCCDLDREAAQVLDRKGLEVFIR